MLDGAAASFAVVANGTAPLTFQWMRNGVAIAGATSATFAIAATQISDDNANFNVLVSNSFGNTASSAALLRVDPAPPTFVANLDASKMLIAGQTATFSVTVTGTAPLSFQWRRNGVAIAGATTSTFATSPITSADDGAIFDVVVTNAAGSATSAATRLAVTSALPAPVVITVQPTAAVVLAGHPATFSVGAIGGGTLTFQWLRNGAPIAGATSSSFTLQVPVVADDGAQISVVVGNVSSTVTSSAARLSVTPQPVLAVFAGATGGPGSVDGPGAIARFQQPAGVVLDPAGNLYVADFARIRRISASGVVSTFVGGASNGSVDGSGSAAEFNFPGGLAMDAAGNLYVADTNNHTVRRVTPTGVVTTIAGLAETPGFIDGTGSSARFSSPKGVAVDASGNVYVADSGNSVLRAIDPSGVVTTIAGIPNHPGNADGAPGTATFVGPQGITFDGSSHLIVADQSGAIRRSDLAGNVTTIATGFSNPTAVAFDGTANFLVTDQVRLSRLTPAGVVATIAGSTTPGFADATGSAARFVSPAGVAVDAAGVAYVSDRGNFAVRRVDAGAVVTTLAGAPTSNGNVDAVGTAARFFGPEGIAIDSSGTLLVADAANFSVRKIAPDGTVTTFATNTSHPTDATQPFGFSSGIGVAPDGTIYVSNSGLSTIERITPAGATSLFAGADSVTGSTDGAGAAARFSSLTGLAVGASGNVFVTDGNTIRKVTPAGLVTTLAGTAGIAGFNDGVGAAAHFGIMGGITVDANDVVYVTDAGSSTVRKVRPDGTVTTIAGQAGIFTSVDGPGLSASFSGLAGLTLDAAGNLFVIDETATTIRKIDTSNNVTTVVGVGDGRGGVVPGPLPGHLRFPSKLVFDSNGTLYVIDDEAILQIVLP